MKINFDDLLKYEKYYTRYISDFTPSTSKLKEAENHCIILSEEEIKNNLKREWKSTIIKIQPLLNHITRYGTKNIVYISQTDSNLLEIYKFPNNVRNHIRTLCEKCNVLYDLESGYIAHRIAKSYYVCHENLKTLVSMYIKLVNGFFN